MDAVYDLIVIGGGPAGVAAAMRGRELGASVALVERDLPGGVCTNDGCVPTRTLAKAARLARDAFQFPEFGLMGQPPQIDTGKVLERARISVSLVQSSKATATTLRQAGIDYLAGSGAASFVGRQKISVGGRTLEAEKVLICAGGHARRLPIEGGDLAITHSDIWSLQSLPGSAVVVGAAATGCQVASILNAFGARVVLLEQAPRILAGEDEDVSAAITTAFETRGIEMLCGVEGLERLEKTQSGLRATFAAAGGQTHRDAAAVLLAVGWTGNLDQLNLGAAAIEAERGYVRVDDQLRTSNPHVYAAGDINGHMMLVQSAEIEARVAVENALASGGDAKRLSDLHAIVPHGSFTDPEYASVGLSEAEAAEQQEVVVARVDYKDLHRALIDGRAEGFAKLIVSRETHRILGVHVVGEQAVETIHIAAAAMTAGLPVESIASIQFAYPTFTSIMGMAARQAEASLAGVSVSSGTP